MRPTKCRAWDKVRGEYLWSDKFPSMWQFFKELEHRGIRHFETEWYTGLCDNEESKEIYYGDIYEYFSYEARAGKQIRPKRIGVVGVVNRGDDYITSLFYVKNIIEGNGTLRVIGNPNENPELLLERNNRNT